MTGDEEMGMRRGKERIRGVLPLDAIKTLVIE